MKLTILAIGTALALGLAAGGRVRHLSSLKVRWPLLAPVGLALQFVSGGGRVVPLVLLYVSFALLAVFAIANLRLPGFPVILLGLALNALVISANAGMPVTRHALEASHQQDTLSFLVHDGGAKHHLASASDVLLPLADTLPIGGGIDQIVSPGDIATYVGLMWLIAACMRPGRSAEPVIIAREEAARVEA